jgi:lipid-binding SYLF domain-containing protein
MQPHAHTLRRWLAALTLAAGVGSGAAIAQQVKDPVAPQIVKDAKDAKDEVERTREAIAVLQDLTKTPDEGIPSHLLARAEAIVVIPSLVKGGFVVGAKHGRGVMSVRDASGAWSSPAYMKVSGGSIGWQIGVQSTDLVLLVMNRSGVDDLLKDRFTIGGNLSVAAGPVGRSADAATDAKLSSQILAYSRTKGLFAGASLEGAALHEDDDANAAMYGPESTARTILSGSPTAAVPDAAKQWRDTLQRLAARK